MRPAVGGDQEADAGRRPCCRSPGGGDDDRVCVSPFRGKTVMLPMLTALLGPKPVSEIQVGPPGLVVRKSVVFQTPPLAPPHKPCCPSGRKDRSPGR